MGLTCWICDSPNLEQIRNNNYKSNFEVKDFLITDSSYGQTASIFRCLQCGFLQCPDLENAISYYEELEDHEYLEGEIPRRLQAAKLLTLLSPFKSTGRLLDIGAGSGFLVSEALQLGYQAEGVEPSDWLSAQGQKASLNIHHGTLPHKDIQNGFDIVTLIDVIEHVSNPLTLLKEAGKVMAKDGIGMMVTPDINSFFARIMGRKWWHYRVAHIGYFNRKSLNILLDRAGFYPIKYKRPCWYFNGSYLLERFNIYLPKSMRFKYHKFLDKVTIPLNLFDSLLVFFAKKPNSHEQNE
jgi:SAM-dependent methyltransferase